MSDRFASVSRESLPSDGGSQANEARGSDRASPVTHAVVRAAASRPLRRRLRLLQVEPRQGPGLGPPPSSAAGRHSKRRRPGPAGERAGVGATRLLAPGAAIRRGALGRRRRGAAGSAAAGRPAAGVPVPDASLASPSGPTAASPRTAIASRAGSESTRAASFGGSPWSNCDSDIGTQFDPRAREARRRRQEGPAAVSNSYQLVGDACTFRGMMATNATGARGAELRRGDSSWRPTGARRASPRGSKRGPTKSRSTASERRHERRWIKDAQRGSGEALEALYRRHWPWAHRAAYLVVHDEAAAEDIAQEAFLAAVRALDRFDRRRPFGPWLHRIVVNRAIDWARARALRGEAEMESEPEATRRVAGRDPRARAQPALLGGRRRRPGHCSRPSTGRWSFSGTCSSTRRARSPRRSSFPAARSTRACAGRSTGSADCSKESG